MSIQFKFRSSVNFDSVDIGGRSSISVRDLKLKIICQKNLNICQDFDLVFSDALTSQEYNDDSFKIPSGSSVIIKRIPARTQPLVVVSNATEDLWMKDLQSSIPMKEQMEDFDDFGIDLCHIQASLFESNLEEDPMSNQKPNIGHSRLGCQKLEASDLSEEIPRGSIHSGTKGKVLKEPGNKKQLNLVKTINDGSSAVQNIDLPSELKCSLCNSFFKEAVMLPCCQHSFCAKCIRPVLTEKARCPKCSSSKCRVEDLLPNLSLGQVIEHFLEVQMSMPGSNDALRKYAPDGESGIRAKNVSCAVTVVQRETDFPYSPTATEKGSNQITSISYYESTIDRNTLLGTPGLHSSKSVAVDADSQGENDPVTSSQTCVPDEVDSTVRKSKGLHLDIVGGERNFMVTGRQKKGDRSCYMCGSPDHLIRDCPFASTPNPMLQAGNAFFPPRMPGFASPYWNGNAYSSMMPFASMYGNTGMMPFNATLIPVTPFGFPPYIPSVHGNLPSTGEMKRMGGMLPPAGLRAELAFNDSEFLESKNSQKRRNCFNGNWGSGRHYDSLDNDEDLSFHGHDNYNRQGRVHEYEYHGGRRKAVDNSMDSFFQRSERKRKSRKLYDLRKDTGFHRGSEERDKLHHRSSKNDPERKGHCDNDFVWGQHKRHKDNDVMRKVASDFEVSCRKHHSYSVSGLEPNPSIDQIKERDCSSRNSKDHMKLTSDELHDARWQIMGCLDVEDREQYGHHKRKRNH